MWSDDSGLFSLDPRVSEALNKAETHINEPEYCFVDLRTWLEHVLNFIERKHSIPKALKTDYDAKKEGPNQYRINRLSACGVSISEEQLKLLHDIRVISNI